MAQVSIAPVKPDTVTQSDIWEQPWKYTGYKKYSWFLASDDDFMIFRKFDILNARVLLALQDEISEAEEKLTKLDEEYSLKTAPRLHNGCFREEKHNEKQQDRRRLVFEIKDKLKEYNEFISNYSNIRSRPAVPGKDIQYVKNWHITNECAIASPEQSYLSQTDDLFQITPRFRTPLRRFLEKSTRFGWLTFFRREPSDRTYYDPNSMYFERNKRLDGFVTMIICLLD